MTDSSESLIGEVTCAETPWVRFRVTRFGGIQSARVMVATTGIRAERRTARKPLPKSSARQGMTPRDDATLVPRQAWDPGTARTGVGRVCILNVRRAVH